MSEIKLMQDIVNGKLIATGKGGEFKNTPWATVVFNVDTDDLIDLEYYHTEEEAKRGHENTVMYFAERKES